MFQDVKRQIAMVCVVSLLGATQTTCASRQAPLPRTQPAPEVFEPLQADLRKSYLELFETASRLEYSAAQLERMRGYLKEAQGYCSGRFADSAKTYEHEVSTAQDGLKRSGITDAERHDLHCRIQDQLSLKNQAEIISKHAIPVAYDNKFAKLEIIEHWPAEQKRIQEAVTSGSYRNRPWADVEDIGFRKIEPNQKDDIKMGQDAIREMKIAGLMLRELENEEVNRYVRNLVSKITPNTDLQVPLQVTVLDSREVNAFALPGGFIYIERGLLEAVEDESQLAGVLSHELSHVVLRHGHKLMRRATIAAIIYQAAQVATMIATGGVIGIGTYYALQYGFFGLGLTLNLALIGVSRDYEKEADTLGIQYAWKSGYDPGGFVRFFDKMATREGYVNGASWFRTHPPFYDRMVGSQREQMYLGRKPEAVLNTTEFARMKEALKKSTRRAEKEGKGKPSLLVKEQGCPPPAKLLYEPDKPIETICSTQGRPQ